MEQDAFQCWLVTPDSCRIRVTEEGLILGRGPTCSLSVPGADVSRVQALVLVTLDGPVLHHLGRNPTRVQGDEVSESVALHHGHTITIGETALRVEVDREPVSSSLWVLESGDALSVRLTRLPFALGGDPHDDLQVPGWPSAALRLTVSAGGLHSVGLHGELAAPARLNGQGRPAGTVTLGSGDWLEIAGRSIGLRSVPPGEGSNAPTLPADLQEVRLHRFPERGGLLTLLYHGGARRAFLPERRCDLVAVLLDAAGAYVPDEEIIRRVWPRDLDKDRTHVNVLVHRLRHDLDKAGLPGELLQRAPGGGALRFAVGSGAICVA